VAGHDVVVVGASAGGVEVLRRFVGGLPPDLPAAIFVVLHIPPDGPGLLPEILARSGPLPARHAKDGERIQHGRVYVAPPDRHLLVEEGQVRVARGPRENGHRPAVDALFRSAAVAYGTRVVGIVLTGTLSDGATGVVAIRRRGGIVIVQEPEEAAYPSMPLWAMRMVEVDHRVSVEQMPPLVASLATRPAAPYGPAPMEMQMEARMSAGQLEDMTAVDALGEPTAFTCPECHGSLWEIRDGELERFRCHIGHAFTLEALACAQDESVDAALGAAQRALEESAGLARRIAARIKVGGRMATRLITRATEDEGHAAVLRRLLQGRTAEENERSGAERAVVNTGTGNGPGTRTPE
jgi:two-component system chemotaxis response regulator CheB